MLRSCNARTADWWSISQVIYRMLDRQGDCSRCWGQPYNYLEQFGDQKRCQRRRTVLLNLMFRFVSNESLDFYRTAYLSSVTKTET